MGLLGLRAHARHVALEDREAAVPVSLQVLADYGSRHAHVLAQHLEHGALERVEERRGRLALAGQGPARAKSRQTVVRVIAIRLATVGTLVAPGARSAYQRAGFTIRLVSVRPVVVKLELEFAVPTGYCDDAIEASRPEIGVDTNRPEGGKLGMSLLRIDANRTSLCQGRQRIFLLSQLERVSS